MRLPTDGAQQFSTGVSGRELPALADAGQHELAPCRPITATGAVAPRRPSRLNIDAEVDRVPSPDSVSMSP